jgi:hypothetical protein
LSLPGGSLLDVEREESEYIRLFKLDMAETIKEAMVSAFGS